jgi:hypothetical protein
VSDKLADVLYQRCQQPVFDGRQMDFFVADKHLPAPRLEYHRPLREGLVKTIAWFRSIDSDHYHPLTPNRDSFWPR